MNVTGMNFSGNYLEYLPLNKITKYSKGPPRDAVAFMGYPQQHPTEKNKLLLVYDPLGDKPAILEFKMEDLVYMEEMPQAVNEKGEGIPFIKLWLRRGAKGMFMEPFEVGDDLNLPLNRTHSPGI